MNEREIIELLTGMHKGHASDLICGIGDDCAVIRKNDERSWLVTMDTLVESVHFDLTWHPPYELGRKSVAVNVSDIGAMGGTPVFIFLSLGLPPEYDMRLLEGISQGMADACREYGCLLAGGDTVRSPSGVLLTITVIGEIRTDEIVFRSGAQNGDCVWVSGFLGNAAAGLELCRTGNIKDVRYGDCVDAHLNPRPRLQLGVKLAKNNLAHSLMDLSDGLATDLAHICHQSKVGAVIDPEHIPHSDLLQQVAELLGTDPFDLMISGGEDYELLFTASDIHSEAINILAADLGIPVTRIGRIDQGQGVRMLRQLPGKTERTEMDISYEGFDHFAASSHRR